MSEWVHGLLLRVVVLVVTIAAAATLVTTSAHSVRLTGLALLALCTVAPLTILSPRPANALAIFAALVFGVLHMAETIRALDPSRTLADPASLLALDYIGRAAVWLPAVLALPGFVAAAGSALRVTASVGEASERLRQTEETLQMLTPEDPESGALSRDQGLNAVRNWLAVGRRYHISMALTLVGIDPPPGVDQQREGAARLASAVAAVLRESLEPTDVVVRHGTYTFVCAMPMRRLRDVRPLIGELLPEATRRTGRPVRASLVEFPTDGDDLDDLLTEAEAALDFCREVGVTLADRHLLAPPIPTSQGAGMAGTHETY